MPEWENHGCSNGSFLLTRDCKSGVCCKTEARLEREYKWYFRKKMQHGATSLYSANLWNVVVLGPFGIVVADANVYSAETPGLHMGSSSAAGTLQLALCQPQNLTATKDGLIHQSTDILPSSQSIQIIMRVF